MDSLVRLLELAYSSRAIYISDVMYLAFQREVQEEQSWLPFLRGWCVHVEDRLVYLDSLICELEICSNYTSVVRFLVELRSADDIVLADAIMYFKAIREFEAEKLANMHLFL